VIRTARETQTFGSGPSSWSVKEGETIICDIYQANVKALEIAKATGTTPSDADFLNHKSSVTEQFADYDPKDLAAMSVTAMIKTIAQMKNARRGHDAQGHLKKVKIDSSDEGYSNFMAPMRIQRISRQVEMILGAEKEIYTDAILRPAVDTYLTAEWDEMVPFPYTWKIRFDGFGRSDYSDEGKPFGKLHVQKIDADALAAPPFYQPQGPSHFGGSFADVACVCNAPGMPCDCKNAAARKEKQYEAAEKAQKPMQTDYESSISRGCGMGH